MKALRHYLIPLALALTACSGDSAPDAPAIPSDPEGGEAVLALRVAIADAVSRAPEPFSVEAMRQLRVIVLRPDGEVEVNYLADFGDDAPAEYLGVFRLAPSEDKTVYAIANPSSTRFPFDSYPAGSRGLAEALEAYEYDFDPTLPIAMTDSRGVDAARLLPGERADANLNIVRVASKFTVEVVNRRDEPVTLASFAVSSLASRQYLMPRFTGSDGRHIVNSQGLKGFDFDNAAGLHWSDWLRLAVDESQADPDNELLADSRGWIMLYGVPEAAAHSPRPFDFAPIEIPRGGTAELPAHYFAESRSGLIADSSFGNGAADGHEQRYTYDITFHSSQGGLKTFTSMPFPNLRALFRNTHVSIRLEIHQTKIVTEVRVLPYVAVDLHPEFGWDTLPDTDPLPDPDPPPR